MTKSQKINLILLFSTLCNLFVLGTTFYDARSLRQSHLELSQTISHNTELLIKLHELERAIGYSGFIHHFKNYVIRGEQQYYLAAQESYKKVSLLIEQVRHFSHEPEIVANLLILEKTLSEYNHRMEMYFTDSERLSISELDDLVRVDDSVASKAVNNIVEKVLPRVSKINQAFLKELEAQLLYSYLISALICIVIIVFTIIVIWQIKKLNLSVDKFSKLFDASPDGIIHADNQGQIIATNKVAQNLFGYSQDEFKTKSIEDLMSHSDTQTHREHREAFTKQVQSKNMMERRIVKGLNKQQQEIPLQIAIGSFATNDEFQSISVIRDMREITTLNQELAFLSSVLKGLSSYVAIVDHSGHLITSNYDLKNTTNKTEQVITESGAWLCDKPTYNRLKLALSEVSETGKQQRFDGVIGVSSELIAVDVVVARLNATSQAEKVLICSAHDISERKSFEQQLLENQEKFKLVVNHISEGIILFKKDGRIDWLNSKAIDMLNPYTQGQIPSNFIKVFAEQEQHEIVKEIDNLTAHNATSKAFQALLPREERPLPVEVTITRYVDDQDVNYLATVSDVSKLLAANERLSVMLEEKSMLLNEIHHRVKNNLQVIMSLLKLQQQHVPKSVGLALQACQHRIRSVALVHQLLYEYEDSSKINFVEYTSKLAQLILLDGINTAPYKVELSLPNEPVYLPINVMIPIGFVINEVLTNAQKHAFLNVPTDALISIKASVDDTSLTLVIKDNGEGFDVAEFEKASSLGHTLIRLFTKQAKGELSIESEKGKFSQFSFKFDLSYINEQ